MRITSKISGLSTAIVLGGLLLSGCSDSADKDSASSSDKSPLEERLGFLYGGEFDQSSYSEQQNKVEVAVAQCMKDQGFEYTPAVYDASDFEVSSDDSYSDTETLDYAKKYGYGVFSQEDLEEDIPAQEPTEEPDADPNAAYLGTLSESELDEYYATLYGPNPDENLSDDEIEAWYSDPANQGCYSVAQSEENTDESDGFFNDPEVAELMQTLENSYNEMTENAKLAELNDAWSECLSTKGFDFATPEDAVNSIYDKSSDIYSIEDTSDGSYSMDSDNYPEPDEAAIEDAKKDEIELATADYECRDKVKYDKTRTKIQWDMEEAFIKENEAAISQVESLYKSYKAGLESK